MPTLKQRKTLENIVESHGNMPVGQAMVKGGYAKATAKNPKNLTESKGWKDLLAEISDEPYLQKINEIALGTDKRAALAAIDMLFKLKDRYPAGKLKIAAAMEEREEYLKKQ